MLIGGAEPEPKPGAVTFLFNDIEGSTRRWEPDPDAMRAAPAIHASLLHHTVADHDGLTFKHTGFSVSEMTLGPWRRFRAQRQGGDSAWEPPPRYVRGAQRRSQHFAHPHDATRVREMLT